jgi:hypothetical protein
MKKILGVIVVVLFLFSCSSSKNTTENAAELRQKIESAGYIIEADLAIPMRGRQIPLGGVYTLELKNDSAFAHLPYFGVAQVAPYGGRDGGIMFEESVKNYSIRPNKKNNGWNIEFEVNDKNHNYRFYLDIFNNGNASINVNSSQRDPISFRGNVR